MASVELNHIYKVYQGGVKAVNDMTLSINDKEFIVFVGPSGCGKSTTLRMIAGLEEISAGELRIDGRIVNDLTPKDRNIAMVFQNYALYPHMTVYENIAYGLRISRVPKGEIDKKVHEAAKILGIEEYLDRKPKALSGGQRQRVALGRAIVRSPKVFLLDEPLSNLDAKLRGDMRSEISKLHNRLGTTFIYVTHDQTEAMTMGTRIVVMKGGYVQQFDTPKNVYNYPANKFVAGFIGTPQMDFFDGTMKKDGEDVLFALDNGVEFTCPYALVDRISTSYMDGAKKICLGIRPDNFLVHEDWMDSDKFAYLAKVKMSVDIVEVLGGETIIYGYLLDKNGNVYTEQSIRVKTTRDVDVHSGDVIDLAIDLRKIHIFDAVTEKTLIKKIPSESAVNVTINNQEAKMNTVALKLEKGVFSQVEEGAAQMFIPSDAVSFGTGDIEAKVRHSEIVSDKKLYELDVDGNLVFALADPSVEYKDGEEVLIAIDQSRLSFHQNGKAIEAFNTTDVLSGKLVKSKEYKTYIYEVEGVKLPISQEQCQKLFSAKGKVILKTPLDFQTSAYDLDMTGKDFTGTVTALYDFGKGKKFAKVLLPSGTSLIVKGEDLVINGAVNFSLNMAKTLIIDHTISIILA